MDGFPFGPGPPSGPGGGGPYIPTAGERLTELDSVAAAQSHRLADNQSYPRIEVRSVSQLLEQTKSLRAKTESKTGPSGSQQNAHQSKLFFASANLDITDLLHTSRLQNLKLPNSIDPPRRIGETNVDAFLKNERHSALNIAIVKAQKETRQAYHGQHRRKMTYDWEREKNALRELLGSGVDIAAPAFRPAPSAAAGPFTAARGQPTMNQAEVQFASVVWKWIEATMGEALYDIVKNFEQASTLMDHMYKDQIAGAWQVVRSMTLIQDPAHTRPTEPFLSMTPAESKNLWRNPGRVQAPLKQHLVNAKGHLERRYCAGTVAKMYTYKNQAPDGGLFHGGALREGWYKKFVHDLAQRDTMFQDLHIEIPSGRIPVQEEWAWAYMYFCMRAGQIHHAQLVYEQELTWDMDVSEKQQLGQALQQYRTFPNNRPEQPPHIPNANTLRDFDKFGGKFKMRVYMLLGLCNVDAKMLGEASPTSTTEDWLWFRLNMVTVRPIDTSQNWLEKGIADLQKELWEGTNEGEGFPPLTFFEALLLTAQFERAINFLRKKQMGVQAVHFAIPLEHIGLLNTDNQMGQAAIPAHVAVLNAGNQASALGPAGPRIPTPSVNFGHMVQSYVRTFQETYVREAMRYYYLLRNYQKPRGTHLEPVESGNTRAGDSLFVHCVTEMVMKTEEYTQVLGSYDQNGYKTPALVDEYEAAWARETKLIGFNKRTIIRAVGYVAEMSGHLYDAINLYDLADDQQQVLLLLNQKLSETASNRRSDQNADFATFRARAIQISQDPRYRDTDATWHARDLLNSMLKIVEFFNLCQENKPQEALAKLVELKTKNYLPVDGHPATNEDCVLAFDRMPHEVLRNLPDLLLYTMHCLNLRFAQVRANMQQARSLDPQQMMQGQMQMPQAPTFQPNLLRNLNPLDDGGQSKMLGDLREHARNLVKFAGRINYRMPGDINAKLIHMEVAMA